MTDTNSTIRLAAIVVGTIIIVNMLVWIFRFGIDISSPLQSELDFASIEAKVLSSMAMGSSQINAQERSYLALYFEHKMKCDEPLACALSASGSLIDKNMLNSISNIQTSVISDQQTLFTSLVMKCQIWGQTASPGQSFSPSATVVSQIENDYLEFLQKLKNAPPGEEPVQEISTISSLNVVKPIADETNRMTMMSSWCPDSVCPNLVVCTECVDKYIVDIDTGSIDDEEYVMSLVEGFFDDGCGEALAYLCKDIMDHQDKITGALKNSEDAYALISNPFKLS